MYIYTTSVVTRDTMLSFPFASSQTTPATPPAIPFDTLVAAAETMEENSIMNQYKTVVENVQEDDAKELMQALVFLATRSHDTPSRPVAHVPEFPPVATETKNRVSTPLLDSLLKSPLKRYMSSASFATTS